MFRVCLVTSYGITEPSEHEADCGETQEYQRFSIEVLQSLASLWHRLSQAKVRSTIQRLGKTTNPLA
jgi:hypothetical protein